MNGTRDVADEVGQSYLSAPNTPRRPDVVSAYEHLQRETDRIFRALVGADGPHAVRIAFTRCPKPYDDDAELIRAVGDCRLLEITSAAIHTERIHPLFGCDYAGPFDRFRAVHDFIGHANTGFGFTLHDEVAAWRIQDRLHGPLARRALATELLAVNSARSIIGEAPSHKAMLLEPDLVRDSRAHLPSQGRAR